MSRLAEFKPVAAEPGRPLYHAVRQAIRHAIDTGQFKAGDQLPSTKDLSRKIDVSLVTVHRALQELVASGVLRRGQGRGTFVHEGYFQRAKASHDHLRAGLVFHDECSLADFYHGHVLEGVRRGALASHTDLVILRFGEDWRRECQGFIYVNPMREQLESLPWFEGNAAQVRGRSTGGGSLRGASARAAAVAGRRPPVLVVGASFDLDHVHSIDCDNADLAVQAVEHLAGLGHRRIAYVGGSSEVCNNIDRWEGFRRAMASRGLPIDSQLVLRTPGWRLAEEDRARLAQLLRGPGAPTAIFAAGYYFALDVYTVANELGLTVPSKLSVVGVDDPPSAEHLSPALTTLRQPLEAMGQTAAAGLVKLVAEAGSVPKLQRLRAELVVRGSTARLRADVSSNNTSAPAVVTANGRLSASGAETDRAPAPP